ncbi:hypothetical protein GCM10023215_43850 [Pseudonocardia yuanmonensis]|uniref:Uncharacterized protein n=1 Tax=Pseudonocardia yuanmonensis TaxID=1095914 RepID=A0ABP8X3W3_9PSEU
MSATDTRTATPAVPAGQGSPARTEPARPGTPTAALALQRRLVAGLVG